MNQCPRCQSTDLRSNKYENLPFDTVARGVLDAVKVGKIPHAFSAAAVWAVVEIVNHTRPNTTCGGCGGVF